jgi:hypothetical protein
MEQSTLIARQKHARQLMGTQFTAEAVRKKAEPERKILKRDKARKEQ